VALAGNLLGGAAARAQSPGLQSCALLIPEQSRIQNYQLLAPQSSVDGKFISYETLIGERRELYISNLETWARFQVKAKPGELFRKKEAFESEMQWYPSQGLPNWFVFVTGDRNNFDIFLGDATQAQKPIPLVNWDSNDHQPVFSPDGKDVAFISTRGRSEGTDLYVILDVDKKIQDPTVELAPVKLTNSQTGVLYPSWSADGRFLSLTIEESEDGVLNDGISVIRFGKLRASLSPGEDASGRVERVRATSPEVYGDFHRLDEVAASWSPDGAYLSFYYSEHSGGRAAKVKGEVIRHKIGMLQVKNFGDDLKFAALEKTLFSDKALDPNCDSFLRGPEWTPESKHLVVAKDSPEEDNPIWILGVPGGEVHEEAGTKLNRDLFVTRTGDGLTVVLFSAHDRQTTSVYRCELR
jgi:dipeptidyl aminopeptidase/acylaminoacyl peptidase